MRYVVSLLLVVSGMLAILADRQRWLPACAPDFDAPDCVGIQSDWYDFAPPGDSWIPIGTTAPLMGTSYALMALATLGLFRAVVPLWWSWVAGAVFAVPFGLLAGTTYASAAAGHAVELPGATASLGVLASAWPVALVLFLLVGILGNSDIRAGAVAATAGLLVLSSPVVLYVTAALLVGYVSHDTSPWTQAIGGAFTALAGVALSFARPRAAPSYHARLATHASLDPSAGPRVVRSEPAER